MRCPECTQETADDAAECPRCGLELAQWRHKAAHMVSPEAPSGADRAAAQRPRPRQDPHPPRALSSRPSSSANYRGFLVSGGFYFLAGLVGVFNGANIRSGVAYYASIVVTMLIGLGLIVKALVSFSSGQAPKGILRTGLGVLAFSLLAVLILAAAGQYGFALVGLAVGIGNGMLLLGQASILRIVLALVILVPHLAFGVLVATHNAVALELGAKLARTIRGLPVTDVQGHAKPYQIFLPSSTRWFEAARQPARADKVLLSPATGAMLSIFVEPVPTPQVSLDELGDTMLKNVRKIGTSFEVSSFNELEREHLNYPTDGLSLTEGLWLRAQYATGKRNYTSILALIRRGKTAYVVFGEIPGDNYPTLAAGLRTMVEGFSPAEEAPDPAASAPKPAAPATPAERQAACRSKCEDIRSMCDCAHRETPVACAQRCDTYKLACFGGCQ